MIVAYTDDEGNHITIESKVPGLYRIWGTTTPPESKWAEWTGTSKDMPQIESFLFGFKKLSESMIERVKVSGAR